jgi:hypothetical protein
MTYVPGSYSLDQQVYAFNQIVNVAFGVTEFQTLPELQQFVNTVLTSTLNDPNFPTYMGNDWQMIWGPMVFSNNPGTNSTVADNSMALFYSPNQKAYVVAIAGTNIDSAYGWLQEDFNVTQTVTWAKVMGTGFNMNSTYADAAISAGSNLGLTALLGLGQQTNNTLISALTNSLNALPSGSQVQVYVSGHSLGGALSPVLALYLHDMQQLSTNWNTKGYVTKINAMPTAGPTPGESNFAAYYSYLCGQTPAAGAAGITYNSVYNSLDIVPHAWEQDELAMIPTIYEGKDQINPPLLANPGETITGSLAAGAFLRGCNTTQQKEIFFKNYTVPANTYTQVSASPAVRTAITGDFNGTLDSELTSKMFGLSYVLPSGLGTYSDYFKNFVRFVAQAGYQHTIAYSGDTSVTPYANGWLKVVEVVAIEQGYKKSNLPSGQTEAQLHQAALARVTGIDLGTIDTSNLPDPQQANA